MTGETPKKLWRYAPTKRNQEKTDREKERERCPGSIIINLHSIRKNKN